MMLVISFFLCLVLIPIFGAMLLLYVPELLARLSRESCVGHGNIGMGPDMNDSFARLSYYESIVNTADTQELLKALLFTESLLALRDTHEYQQKPEIRTCTGRISVQSKYSKVFDVELFELTYRAEKLRDKIALKLLPYWEKELEDVKRVYANSVDLTQEEILDIIRKEVKA